MSLKKNLIRARAHIIFIIALISAFTLVITLENMTFEARVSPKSTMNMMPYRAKKHHMPDHICPYFKSNAIIPQYGNYTERKIYAKANLPGKLGELSC